MGGLDIFFNDKIYFDYHFKKKQIESILTLKNDNRTNEKFEEMGASATINVSVMKIELNDLDNVEEPKNNIKEKTIDLNFQKSSIDNIFNNSKINDKFLEVWNAKAEDVDVILKKKNATEKNLKKSNNLLSENLKIELCSELESLWHNVNPNILHVMLYDYYNIANITRSKKTNSLYVNFTHFSSPIKVENMNKALSLINYVIYNKKEMLKILLPVGLDGYDENRRKAKPVILLLNVLGIMKENKLITNHNFLNEFENFDKKNDNSNTM